MIQPSCNIVTGIESRALALNRRPLLCRVKNPENGHGAGILGVNNDVVRLHNQFPRAGHTSFTETFRVLSQPRNFGLNLVL